MEPLSTVTPRAPTRAPAPPPPPPPPSAPARGDTTATAEAAPARTLAPGASRAVTRADEQLRAQAWAARMSPVPASDRRGPPAAHDVSQVTPDQLRAMSRSSDPNQVRLGQTIARAQVAHAETIRGGGRVLASASEGNGGRPVLTVIPPGFDPHQPARVQTHYHGFHATVADPPGHSSGTTSRMREVQARDPQAVFVLPEAANAPARGGAYRTDWSNVSSQARTTADALAGAGITQVGARVVSAHSGGGAALASAIRAHPDGSGLAADRLELHDSLYGSQHDLARWARTPSGRALDQLRYFHGTNDRGADAPLAAAFGERFARTDVRAPKSVPHVLDERGRSVPRYSADAHNRTVAEFLGTRD